MPQRSGNHPTLSPPQSPVARYALTLLAIAEFSKVAVISLSSSARGKLVVIASAGDLTRMPRILEKAKENCFISDSIKSAITVEPEGFHH